MNEETAKYCPPADVGNAGDAERMLETLLRESNFGNEELRKRIKELIERPENFLGEGGVGRVYDLGDQCIKLMPNRHADKNAGLYNLGNTTSKEYHIQHFLRDLVVDGVFAPRVFSFYEGKKVSAIVMERLDAVNMQMVINGHQELPKDFVLEDFFDALENYIFEMHASGIVHCDLDPRNIMIDRKTGKPRLIDFGRSKIVPKDSEKRSEKQQKLVDDDNIKLDETIKTMDGYLKNK